MKTVVLIVLLAGGSLFASQPVFYFPSVIRGCQEAWQSSEKHNPNGVVRFIGPFGLHPLAAAKYGWDEKSCLDSAKAFHLAQTLWLDYLCSFKDSALADMALVYGPAEVVRSSNEIRLGATGRIEEAKGNSSSEFRALYTPRSFPSYVVIQLDAEPPVQKKASVWTYKVKKGDSLWKIHRKYPHISLEQLLKANGGKEGLQIGQTLRVRL